MQKWEYKNKYVSGYVNEEELNELGRDGWELVGIAPVYEGELHGEFGRVNLEPDNILAYFKRPLSE